MSQSLKTFQSTQIGLSLWSEVPAAKDFSSERVVPWVRRAYDKGVRSFFTADSYGLGKADEFLGGALSPYERDSYFLAGAVGLDFYNGRPQMDKFYPPFTDSKLRSAEQYASYLKTAAESSLKRLRTRFFDVLFLQYPNQQGFTQESVWRAFKELKEQGLTRSIGIMPGPGTGYILDLIEALEKNPGLIDSVMIRLNPAETWPNLVLLPVCQKLGVKVIAYGIDVNGIFYADFPREGENPSASAFRKLAAEQNVSALQLSFSWVWMQPAISQALISFLGESQLDFNLFEKKCDEFIQTPKTLSSAALEQINKIFPKKAIPLKGASSQYFGIIQRDQWSLSVSQKEIAKKWGIDPDRDLYDPSDIRDLREKGAPVRGVLQTSLRRLYFQLLVFGNCHDTKAVTKELENSGLEAVLYLDANDPFGIGILLMSEDPEIFTQQARNILAKHEFSSLQFKPDMTMLGRSYSTGYEPDLEDWLLHKPRRTALNSNCPWAVWYPLKRKPEFALLSKEEQGKILLEHAQIGRTYGQAGYAADIRLACYGLDRNDNEFVIGLVGSELYPLSRIVQEMRKTQQTSRFMQHMGPFFVGKVLWHSSTLTKKA